MAAHAEQACHGDTAALSVARLLRLALRNEYEATELAGCWVADTRELDAKLAFARQAGDESKHYRLIEAHLHGMGDRLHDFDPAAPGPSPLLVYLKTVQGTVARAAAGPFAREALAVARNEVFAQYCASVGDTATEALYRTQIQPDEQHHHALGKRLLLRYAVTPTAQRDARAAALRTLQIADELQEMAQLRMGLSRIPGC